MSVDHKNKFKRDVLHETPLASHDCEVERAFHYVNFVSPIG
jgi:hypothetical protein